jgi:hypothetical protein
MIQVTQRTLRLDTAVILLAIPGRQLIPRRVKSSMQIVLILAAPGHAEMTGLT